MRIQSDPLQEAIANVMRVLTIILVVGVAARKMWHLAGKIAAFILDRYDEWRSNEPPSGE